MTFLKSWYNIVAIILTLVGIVFSFFAKKVTKNFKYQKWVQWLGYALIPFGILFFFYEHIYTFIEEKIASK